MNNDFLVVAAYQGLAIIGDTQKVLDTMIVWIERAIEQRVYILLLVPERKKIMSGFLGVMLFIRMQSLLALALPVSLTLTVLLLRRHSH